MKKKTQKSTAESLGLKRLDKLTQKACRERAEFLRARAEKGAYKGELREKALSHAAWYASKANALKKAA